MDIKEIFVKKLTAATKAEIEKYHSTVRRQHDFVDWLIINGANQDFKCADRDTADCAIRVTNELNENFKVPMLCFDHISFSEDMKLEYWFQLFAYDCEGWFDVIYSDGSLCIDSNHNWDVLFEEVSEASLLSMLADLETMN